MYERFTDRARKVLQLANQEAQRFKHVYIVTEHILLGLVKEGSGVAANVLKNLNVDLRKVEMVVERDLQRGTGEAVSGALGWPKLSWVTGRLPHTPRAKKVLEYAVDESRRLNHNYIGTEHLLLGLLREDGVAAQVLTDRGLKIEDIREEILNLLGHNLPNEMIPKLPEPAAPPCDPRTRELDEQIELLNSEMEEAIMDQDFDKEVSIRDRRGKVRKRRTEILSMFSQSGPDSYERFSDRARRVMKLANQESQQFNHEYIGTEHILLGLVKEGAGVASNVLKNLNIGLGKIRGQIEKIVQHGPSGEQVIMGRLPHTPQARKAIDFAVEEARNLNHPYVGTEHLLLGLIREQEGVAAQVLLNLGLLLENVRAEVLKLLGSSTKASGSEGSPPASDESARGEATIYSSARAAAESLTVYQIELVNDRIRLLNQQMKESVAAQDLVQAGRFRSEAEGLSKLLVLYFWSRGHN